jgi:Holliday junction resolvasome RuvABC ATP-dependent DNA helicase subunit
LTVAEDGAANSEIDAAIAALEQETTESRGDVRAEAASLAAFVARSSAGAADAWARTFSRPATEFARAVDVGSAYAQAPTPVLARRLGSEAGRRYARDLATLAMAAAALGELSVSALATATVVGNAQLGAAGAEPAPVVTTPLAAPARVADGPAAAGQAPDSTPAHDAAPAPTLEELFAELDGLVGLDAVKTEVRRQAQVLRIRTLRGSAGLRNPDLTRHLVFVGNPGTGKTTVARLVGAIYRAVGVLPQGQLVECDRSELVAGYVGQTALKTAEVVGRALGGALFVDEAYALANDDFGREAIDTLVKEMEDHRDELLVIVAGYPEPMQRFITSNPGLESRFRLTLRFDDYSDDDLVTIFERIAADADFAPTDAAIARLREILAATPRGDGFGNGRFVRTLFESAVVRQAWRLRDRTDLDVAMLRELQPDDLDGSVAAGRP